MGCSVVLNSMWILALMPSWSRCLLVSGAVSGWMLGAAGEERTKEREQLLCEKVQSQNRMRKLEAGHVAQIAELEVDATNSGLCHKLFGNSMRL